MRRHRQLKGGAVSAFVPAAVLLHHPSARRRNAAPPATAEAGAAAADSAHPPPAAAAAAGRAAPGWPTRQQGAFQQLVGLVPHDLPVLAGARLALIAIHHQIVGAVVVLRPGRASRGGGRKHQWRARVQPAHAMAPAVTGTRAGTAGSKGMAQQIAHLHTLQSKRRMPRHAWHHTRPLPRHMPLA